MNTTEDRAIVAGRAAILDAVVKLDAVPVVLLVIAAAERGVSDVELREQIIRPLRRAGLVYSRGGQLRATRKLAELRPLAKTSVNFAEALAASVAEVA